MKGNKVYREAAARRTRILIVEDERDLAGLMQVVLEDEGYEVAVHPSGDCFDLLRRFEPDLMICDYMLPVYDGEAVIRRVRRDFSPNLPIIMASAVSRADQEWRSWGADDFLLKPFDIGRLMAVVDRAAGNDAQRWSPGTAEAAGEQAS
ncbi:MAG TPA: response regulator transcription factor [Chloroflexota bacterium]